MEKTIRNMGDTANEIAEGTENMSVRIEEQLGAMTELESTTEQFSQMAKRLCGLTAGFWV